MNNPIGMQINQRPDNLLNIIGRVRLRKEPFLPEQIKQRSRSQLHHQIQHISLLVVFIELENILMLYKRLNLYLVYQPLNQFRTHLL